MYFLRVRGGLLRANISFGQRIFRQASQARSSLGDDALFDSHGRRHTYLRISLTEKCNLRCEYCMPVEGVPLTPRRELLTSDELARLVRVLATRGVDKLRLTGGEPSVRRDLEDVVRSLAATPGVRAVSMTSNGAALVRRLAGLRRAGLAGLNLSLDSLRPERWAKLCRRPAALHARVFAAADLALQLDIPLKVNVVLMRGVNDDEIGDFVELTRERALDVRFIEFMPFSGNEWQSDRMVSYQSALSAAKASHADIVRLPPDTPHDTAKVWRVPGYAGRVGFITSMTEHFCGSCNRMRLTADGNLKVCLFGNSEVSLRDAIRAGARDEEIVALVRGALANKKAKHAATRAGAAVRGVATLSHVDEGGRARMVDVGGKERTRREAAAEAKVFMSAEALRLLRNNALGKGDALCVAETAGVLAAKRTAELIPLCHTLALTQVRVRVSVPEAEGAVSVTCTVKCSGRTGAEMEALTGCAVAALTLYDMTKAVDAGIVVSDLRLVRKSGGKTDYTAPHLHHTGQLL